MDLSEGVDILQETCIIIICSMPTIAFMMYMLYVKPLSIVKRGVAKLSVNANGSIVQEEISKRTPVGDGYNFDEVM